jgi:hypothetical protein
VCEEKNKKNLQGVKTEGERNREKKDKWGGTFCKKKKAIKALPSSLNPH